MNVHPQYIMQKGSPTFVVLPIKDYELLLEKLQDIEDIKAIEESVKDTSERFPLELVESIASGESPVKAFRKYREISQVELAKKVKVSRQYISQVEHNERKGSITLLKKIAKALNVSLDDLV